jgi:hypothetical protein
MLLQDDAKEEEEDEDVLFLKKPMPHVLESDCHFGKSTNNKKGTSNHEQVQTL